MRNFFDELFCRRNIIRPGLERVREAYALLGYPSFRTKTVLIGGTNGKGSTAGYLWQLLCSKGLKVGLYTSPHLIHFTERFQVNGFKITTSILKTHFLEIKAGL